MIENNNLLPAVMSIEEKGKNHSLQWIGSQAQEILRIESGIPLYGVDIGEDNLLLETGLDQTVSFDKGCYLGQEVVERVHSRGHVNKKLVGMLLEGGETAHRGAAIDTKQASVGRVTSSVFSPALGRPLALGYVQREFTEAGTSVAIQHNGGTIQAEVCPLPFYRNPGMDRGCQVIRNNIV